MVEQNNKIRLNQKTRAIKSRSGWLSVLWGWLHFGDDDQNAACRGHDSDSDRLAGSVGDPDLMISVPALLTAVFALVVILVADGLDRRRILASLVVLLTITNPISAFASILNWMLLTACVVVGFCMGSIWAIAGGLAPRFVPQ